MAPSKLPWFKFYVQDFMASPDVQMMGPAGRGAYVWLLCCAWASEDCGLPADDNKLAVLSGLGEQWHGDIGRAVRAKFREEGGRLFNDRLLAERKEQAEFRERCSAAGRKSARIRKEGLTDVEPTCQPKSNKSESESESESESDTHTETEPSHPSGESVREGVSRSIPQWKAKAFSEFWEGIWAKIGKGAAKKAYYRKAKTPELAAHINEQARTQGPILVEQAERGQRSVIHPATWINGGRYDDEGIEAAGGNGGDIFGRVAERLAGKES